VALNRIKSLKTKGIQRTRVSIHGRCMYNCIYIHVYICICMPICIGQRGARVALDDNKSLKCNEHTYGTYIYIYIYIYVYMYI